MYQRLYWPALLCLLYSIPGLATTASQSDKLDELLSRGERQFERGNVEKALKTFRRAQEAENSSQRAQSGLTKALYGFAQACRERGDYGQASDALEEMLELTNNKQARLAALTLLGSVRYQDESLPEEQRLREAEQFYGQAYQMSGGNDWSVGFSLALVLKDRGQLQQSLALLRRFSVDELELEDRRMVRALTCGLKVEVEDPAAISSREPLQVQGDVQKPVKILSLWPQYSGEALKQYAGRTGSFEAVIDEEGCVRSLEVLEELPSLLLESTESAISRWVFDPATLHGEPIPVYYRVTIDFTGSGTN